MLRKIKNLFHRNEFVKFVAYVNDEPCMSDSKAALLECIQAYSKKNTIYSLSMYKVYFKPLKSK